MNVNRVYVQLDSADKTPGQHSIAHIHVATTRTHDRSRRLSSAHKSITTPAIPESEAHPADGNGVRLGRVAAVVVSFIGSFAVAVDAVTLVVGARQERGYNKQ